MATEYGTRLREARKSAGLTQTQLSEKTGIPQSTISTAERSGNSSAESVNYADACGVSLRWLANGDGSMRPATQTITPPPIDNQNISFEAAVSIGQAMQAIAAAMQSTDDISKATAKAVMLALIDDPSRAPELAIRLESFISPALEPPKKKKA